MEQNGFDSAFGAESGSDSQKSRFIICDHCPRHCRMAEGRRGFCHVRENRNGRSVCTAFGRSTGLSIDPIEKKPLFHFLPGSRTLSLGTIGCNLNCNFCQNWTISRCVRDEVMNVMAAPDEIAALAHEKQCQSVAFTYNEPGIWSEYAIEIGKACKTRGIQCVAVTNGFICGEARRDFYSILDGANIDLKGFTEDFYERFCSASLAPVLETIEWVAKETDVWLELTNLIIPRANDRRDEIARMCDWIVEHVGPDVPLHFSAFFPKYHLVDRPPTSWETLKMACQTAKKAGVRYVYVGNCSAPGYESTWCPNCAQMLLSRNGWHVSENHISQNRCVFCGTKVPGRFAVN